MKRGVALLLVLCLCAVAFWGIRRRGGRARAAPKPVGETAAPADAAFPGDPKAFVARLWNADAEEVRAAGESLREPGEAADALLRAAVAAIGPEVPWAEDFLDAVGPRALPLLKERFLRPDGLCRDAFRAVMRLAGPDERQAFLVACLSESDREVQGNAAEWIHGAVMRDESDAERFVPSAGLLSALARTFAKAPLLPSESESYGVYSGPPSLSEELRDALAACFDGDTLRALCADPAPEVRAGAVRAIAEWMEPDREANEEEKKIWDERARVAVDVDTQMLADPDPRVRAAALTSLGFIARHVAVPRDAVLAKALDTAEAPEVRAAAALALDSMEGDPTEELVPCLGDPDAAVRAAALKTIGSCLYHSRATPPQLEPRLRAALDDADPRVRAAAAEALDRYAEADGAPCRARLAAGLADPSEAVRVACAGSLCHRSPPPVEALPYLERWLTEGSEKERDVALDLARKLGEKAAPLEQAILSVISKPDAEDRGRYIEVLAEIPGKDDRVLEAMLAASGESAKRPSSGLSVRAGAVLVLGKRFLDDARARDVVCGALSDKEQTVAEEAAKCLAERGLETQAVVRACVRMLDQRGDGVSWMSQQTAVELLGGYGVEAREAVPALLRFVDDTPYFTEGALARTLAKLPELAAETVPALVERAVNGNRVALAALEWLGPAAEPHLSAAVGRLSPDRQEAFAEAQKAFREAVKAKDR